MTPICLLKTAVFLPLSGALLIPFISKISVQTRNLFALTLGILTFTASLMLMPHVLGGMTITYNIPFPLGFNFTLTADMLSVFMALISSFVSSIILFYSIGYMAHYENQTEYYAMVVLFLGSMMGIVYSTNLIWMYVFWEITAVCSWRLVGFFRAENDILKANKTILVTVFGALCMLLGFVMIYSGKGTLDLSILRGETISLLAAFLILAGILAKSSTLPFSTWLPDAGVAPSTVTALLHAAVLVKIGVYAYARIFGTSVTVEPVFAQTVLIIAGLSAIISAGAALVETNIKRLIAYSTISQLGFIFLGLASGNNVAFIGALIYILTHSVAKGGLFLIAGILEQKTHTKDITKMGGLFKTMPITAICFILCALSIMAIPPLGGFFGKFLVFAGAIQNGNPWIIAMFMFAAILTVLYLLRLFYLVFLGEAKEHPPKEGSPTMLISVAMLALISLLLGALIYYPMFYTEALSLKLGVFLQ